jgi:hypothetical protein
MTLGEFKAWLEGFTCSFTVTQPDRSTTSASPARRASRPMPSSGRTSCASWRRSRCSTRRWRRRAPTWRDLNRPVSSFAVGGGTAGNVHPDPSQGNPAPRQAPAIINPMAAGSYLGLQATNAGAGELDAKAFLRDASLTEHAPPPDEGDVAELAQAVEAGDEESYAAIKARIQAKRASD